MNNLLSIVIVNFRSGHLIVDCLQSVYQYSSIQPEVIVVDNLSGDNSEALITATFPQVKWIQMGYNAGFARANNAGIRQSRGDIVLLLNPDTLIRDNAIEKAYVAFQQSDYVACGVQLQNPDGSPQISGNYFMKGGLNHLLPLPYTGKLLQKLGYLLNVKKTNVPEAKGVVEVDWVNGAFLMVKKKAIDEAGLLDEDFFLYAEEIEWCARLRKIGKMCIYGNLHVVHLQGEVAGQAFLSEAKGYYNLFDRKGKQLLVSNFLRIRKQYGMFWFLSHLFVYLMEIPVFFFGVIVEKIVSPQKTYSLSAVKGFSKNMLFLLGKAGIMLRNRPYFYKVL